MILVAGGEEKALALLAMLKGGYINTLISDQKTLELILNSKNIYTLFNNN
ncbi:sugar-binding domain-containing protein [Oceanotoga sp.]